MDGVVLVEVGGGEHTAEGDAEEHADDVEPHRSPPVAIRRTKVVRIAVAMKVTVTATLAGERWAVPHMPWPEVQPPATAAP